MKAGSDTSWKTIRLTDVTELNPRHFSQKIEPDAMVSFIPMKAVEEESGRVDTSATRSWEEVKRGYTPFQDGDVIFAKITPCMENGKFAVVRGLHNGVAVGSTEFHVLRPAKELDATFLMQLLLTPQLRHAARQSMRGAAGQLRVPTSFFEGLEITLPPLDEQRKRVAFVEKQLSRLDVGASALNRVHESIRRYRNSVLVTACSGNLFSLNIGHSGQQPASELLSQILSERKQRWGGRGAYREPTAPDHTDLSTLPSGWTWATLEQLTSTITSGSRGWGSRYSETGPLFIRAQDIRTDTLELSGIARVQVDAGAEGTRSSVKNGDILVTITGASVTRSAMAQGLSEKAFVSQHVAVLKPAVPEIAQYIYYWIVSPGHGRQYLENCAYGAAKPGLSLSQLRSLPVALPPLEELHRIVAEVERRLSVLSGLETLVSSNLLRAVSLRQSVFRTAFSSVLASLDETLSSASRTPAERSSTMSISTKKGALPAKSRSLIEVLEEAEDALTPEDLFARSGRDPYSVEDVEDFFSQLRDLVRSSRVEELRPDNTVAKIRILS